MDLRTLTISGILNLFRYGLLQPSEIIEADNAINEKIIWEAGNIIEKALYCLFQCVVQRIKQSDESILNNTNNSQDSFTAELDLINETTRKIKKFNTQSRCFTFSFKPVNEEENPMERLKNYKNTP